MANISAQFGLLALFISLSLAQDTVFTFTASNSRPMEGETVTLLCKVENLPLSRSMQMDRLDPNNPPAVVIGTNGKKDIAIDRYTTSLVAEVSEFTLTITGVMVEDTGTFRCGDPKEADYAVVELSVLADPKTISLTLAGQEVEDGEEFEMKAGDLKDIVCTVGGSQPAPSVTVIVEDKKGKTVKDITAEFDMISTVENVPDADKDNMIRTFDKSTEQTVATATGLSITPTFSMKFVKCIGSIEGGKVPVEKKYFVRFSGMAPVFDCPSSFVSHLGETDYRISCNVTAVPSLGGTSVSWKYGMSANYTRTIDNTNPTSGHYVYSQEKIKYENVWKLSLYIDRIHPQLFRNYTFRAYNDHGSVEHEVSLNDVVGADMDLSLSISQEYVHEGEEVSMNCHISNPEARATRFLVKWYKYVDNEKLNEVALFQYVSSPYKDTNRYTGVKEINANMTDILFKITISDVQKTDSGKYGCEITGVEGSLSFVDLYVLSDTELIQISADGEVIPDASEAVFPGAPESTNLQCLVEGAYPLPDVHMYSGDENITHLFEQTQELQREGVETSLQALSYRVTLSNPTFAMTYQNAGKVLKCVSRVPHSDFEEQSTSHSVMLAGYQPDVSCPEEVTFDLHESNVNITCVINAKPGIDEAFVVYRQGLSANLPVILQPGDRRVHYRVELLDGESENEKLLVLFIDRIFPQHNRDHNFTACNSKGDTITTVFVKIVDNYSSAAPAVLQHPGVLLLLIFILAAFRH